MKNIEPVCMRVFVCLFIFVCVCIDVYISFVLCHGQDHFCFILCTRIFLFAFSLVLNLKKSEAK